MRFPLHASEQHGGNSPVASTCLTACAPAREADGLRPELVGAVADVGIHADD